MTKKQRENTVPEIDLIPILKALVSRLWLIILVGVIVGGAVFAGTKLLIKPSYRSGFTAYINNQTVQNGKDSLTYSDITASQQLTQTYRLMIQSRSVLMSAAKQIKSDLSYNRLVAKTSITIKDETEILYVYVVDEDPEFAYKYATAIADIAPQYISDFVEGSSMKIIDYPVKSDTPFGPSYIKYALLGFLLGALIIFVKTIVEFFMDDRIRSEQEIEERFDIPILGIIPDVSEEKKAQGYYEYQKKS